MENQFYAKDVQDMFKNLDEKVDIIFKHQMIMSVYQSNPRDYDLGFYMSEVEIHALGFIAKEDGITAKRLGEITYRSKGTISAMINKLESEGFLEQTINLENKRERNLHLTPLGEKVCYKHVAYDRRVTSNYLTAASEFCTPEEINGFFKITQFRSEYFEKVIKEEKENFKKLRKENRTKNRFKI